MHGVDFSSSSASKSYLRVERQTARNAQITAVIDVASKILEIEGAACILIANHMTNVQHS